MKAIILAAGVGSRLEKSIPKTLTKLDNNEMILERQLNFLNQYIPKKDIIIVVGYKKELIIKEFPNYKTIYNKYYSKTNTAKSLMLGLEEIYDEDIVWINGDVVFNKMVLEPIMNFNKSCMLVNTMSVGEEEIKYTVNSNGYINQVSKVVSNGLGEAVGINRISKAHLTEFKKTLEECNQNDYFEYALEIMIKKNLKLSPIDISDSFCMEIDFKSDLELVNKNIQKI